MKLLLMVVLFLGWSGTTSVLGQPQAGAEAPFHRAQEIFPLQHQHVHGPTVVELPNGDLLAGWFQGSGERWADDVAIMGARLRSGDTTWSSPFVLADVPEFPDINPILFLDARERLWLMWYTVLANQWETSLVKYRISENYLQAEGPPVWAWQEVLHVKPGDRTERGIQPGDRFAASVARQVDQYTAYLSSSGRFDGDAEARRRWEAHAARLLARARGEDMIRDGREYQEDGSYVSKPLGYPYFRRMGWQTKNKPVLLDEERLIVPLYSDGFSFSLMALTDDGGASWRFSEPLVGAGNIQPSIAEKRDGTLVAYMRDNGPPPKRLHVSTSSDRGLTWTPVRDAALPNPGAGADVVTLRNGHWVLVNNDTEEGRHSLAVSLSEDEGQTWPWTRHLELDERPVQATRSHYPAVIQARDGNLHVVYSFHHEDRGEGPHKTIKHAHFNEAWIRAGHP